MDPRNSNRNLGWRGTVEALCSVRSERGILLSMMNIYPNYRWALANLIVLQIHAAVRSYFSCILLNIWSENPNGRGHSEDIGIDGKIIFE
jgi:hypothetical protein